MSFEKAHGLIRLATLLKGSSVGLTLDDIKEKFNVSRRTAERMRDAVIQLTGEELVETGPDGKRYWRLRNPGILGTLTTVSAEELASLHQAKILMKRANQNEHATNIGMLAEKVAAALDSRYLNRIEPDLEILTESEGIALRPGPRPNLDKTVLKDLRKSILASCVARITYVPRGETKQSKVKVHPYGLLYGSRHYLVGYSLASHAFRLYSLSGIKVVERLDETFLRDTEFSLEGFANKAFGIFQDGNCFDVHWRFEAVVADDVKEFHFHPTQQLTKNDDGTIDVKFRASGLREMCWHLVTWAGVVKILAPKELKSAYQEFIRAPRL